jgi:ABC-type uncharacterized transport system permease subunit
MNVHSVSGPTVYFDFFMLKYLFHDAAMHMVDNWRKGKMCFVVILCPLLFLCVLFVQQVLRELLRQVEQGLFPGESAVWICAQHWILARYVWFSHFFQICFNIILLSNSQSPSCTLLLWWLVLNHSEASVCALEVEFSTRTLCGNLWQKHLYSDLCF